jgi:hypothetical protein
VNYVVVRNAGGGYPENDGPQQRPHETDILRPFAENSDVTGQKEEPTDDGYHALQDRGEDEGLDDALKGLRLRMGGKTVEKPGGKKAGEKVGDDPDEFL